MSERGGGGGGVEFWGFRVYLGLRVFSGFPAVEKGLWSLGGCALCTQFAAI